MTLIIPGRVARAIKEHAHNPSPKRKGREVVGYIIAHGNYAFRYERLRNIGRGDHRFRVGDDWPPRLRDGEKAWLVHSHPSGIAAPSEMDLKLSEYLWRGVPYGIYGVESDTLAFYELGRKTFTVLDHIVVG